jgi:hypothetical protein
VPKLQAKLREGEQASSGTTPAVSPAASATPNKALP